jgi:hypothetical protein
VTDDIAILLAASDPLRRPAPDHLIAAR